MSIYLMHLLWADDLILMSDSEEGLQKQFDNLLGIALIGN